LLGLAGSCLAYRVYRKARTTCPPFRKQVYSGPMKMVADFGEFWRHPERLRSLRGANGLRHPLAEKIMLAVTSVNGSRSSSYAHARFAMRRGLSQAEVEALLSGDVQHVAPQDAPAVLFARRYAEHRGQPDPHLVQNLVDTYGDPGARDIASYVCLVNLANLVGNTFDALISRILGQPSPDSSLRAELSLLVVFMFGIVPLVPLVVLRSGQVLSGWPGWRVLRVGGP